jgi:hypothetical protein
MLLLFSVDYPNYPRKFINSLFYFFSFELKSQNLHPKINQKQNKSAVELLIFLCRLTGLLECVVWYEKEGKLTKFRDHLSWSRVFGKLFGVEECWVAGGFELGEEMSSDGCRQRFCRTLNWEFLVLVDQDSWCFESWRLTLFRSEGLSISASSICSSVRDLSY